MSAIYGYFRKNDLAPINLEKTYLWNLPYGTKLHDSYTNLGICMGCNNDLLSVHSHAGSPILQGTKNIAVMDAVLYNHSELADKCNIANAISDELLLLTAIEQFGFSILAEVNGDFSGAIYDPATRHLTLFRDHMGIRPLFYYMDEQLLAFSTDIRGLLALDEVDTSLNEDWVYRTCAGYYLDGVTATEYAHIFCIPPASYVTFFFEQEHLKCMTNFYWHLGQQKIRLHSLEAYKHALNELITDSVKKRLSVIPGKIGAELSGGLDSSVIDILIHRLGRDALYFSWSASPEEVPYAPGDERLVIADICSQEGISCHFSKTENDRGAEYGLYHTLTSIGVPLDMEAPPAFRYALPPYINAFTLSDTSEFMHSNGVNVVFTGHGGDEGVSHRCNPYELFYHHEYFHFLKYLWSTTHGQKRRIIRTLKAGRRTLHNSRNFYKPFSMPFSAAEFINSDFADKFKESDMPRLHFAFDSIRYIEKGGSRNRLDNVALLGAYNGVRYLVPYLDYRVIDFAVSVPRYLYLQNGKNRYLFRETFKDIMPDSLYQLKTKEDTSWQNYKKRSDKPDDLPIIKGYVYKKLDPAIWSDYLDFRALEKWMAQDLPSPEGRGPETNKLLCLFYCAMASELIQTSKKISPPDDLH